MQETKDPAIKLFGQMIPLQSAVEDPAISGHDSADMAIDAEKGGGDDGGQTKRQDDEADKELQNWKVTESPEEKESEQLTETAKSSKNDDGAKSEEKILKKPDKVLPCPRCSSMNTKFCYYNNYNINQPRHFCKSCQRYWTAGGTMRNVPVGAGRRKTKNNSSQLHYTTIDGALRVARISAPNNRTNGEVFSFGSDSPRGSVLNHVENKVFSRSTRNGFHDRILEHQRNTYFIEESKKNSTFQVSCLPGVPWPVPPGFPPPSSNHPAAFWNYGANLPRFSTNSSSPTLKSSSSGSNSLRLGKHTRDGDMLGTGYLQKEEGWKQRNGSVLVPKTLRIDDPSEAAKSSMWTTLGMRKESLNCGSMFDAFQWNKDGKDQKRQRIETSSVLRANPAALSRSVYFHENT